jgi:hypothetical protein
LEKFGLKSKISIDRGANYQQNILIHPSDNFNYYGGITKYLSKFHFISLIGLLIFENIINFGSNNIKRKKKGGVSLLI